MNWAVGHNLAGYMPESDVEVFESWQDAAEYFDSTIREYADQDDDASWDANIDVPREELGDWYPAMLATVASILRDDPPRSGEEYGAIVSDNQDRPISFWIIATDEPVSEEL